MALTTDLGNAAAAIDDVVERCREPMNMPGVALAVTDRDHLLYTSYAGVCDAGTGAAVGPATLFEIGSISKSFTALLVLQLWQEGELDLHAPVTDVLPWFAVRSPYGPITPHHLLTHTAGLVQGSEATPAGPSEVWGLRDLDVGGPPGSPFHYSNHGYKTLGLILERITGRPYGETLRERILGPLGMERTEPAITRDLVDRMATGYEALFDDRPLGAGGRLAPVAVLETDTADGSIASTAEDMAGYLRVFLNDGRGPGGPVVTPDALAIMISPHTPSSDPPYHDDSYGYGLNVEEVDGRRRVGHGGGMVGYSAHIGLDLDVGVGVVVLTNGPWSPFPVADFALRAACAAVDGGLPPPSAPDPGGVADPGAYSGTYVEAGSAGGARRIRVAAKESELVLEIDGGGVRLRRTEDPDAFVVPEPSMERFCLVFERANGEVTGVVHGADRFVREGSSGSAAPDEIPEAWRAYPGHYRSHNPWFTNFRIVGRGGALLLIAPGGVEAPGSEQVLVPRDDGSFRLGRADSPEQILFDTTIDGMTVHANLSGGDYYRTFTP